MQGLQVFIGAYSYKWQNINININKYKCKRALLASVHWSAQLWQPRVLFPPFLSGPLQYHRLDQLVFDQHKFYIAYNIIFFDVICNSNWTILNIIEMGIWTVDSTFFILFKLHSYKIS